MLESCVIILTMFSNQLKDRLCNFFCQHGHTVIASGEEASHLICGVNKPMPTLTLISALIDAGVHYIRIIDLGMKQKLDTFPAIPRDLLASNATDHGYPPNEWDTRKRKWETKMLNQYFLKLWKVISPVTND
jgi:hypothetical protein